MAMPSTAIYMVAGQGTRLAPLTRHMPKPLLPICNKAPLVQTMEQATSAGVNTHILKLVTNPGMFLWSLGSSVMGAEISYALHKSGLVTAGGVKKIMMDYSLPKDYPVWVFSGDTFCPELSLGELVDSHEEAVLRNPQILGTVAFKLFPAEACVNRFGVAVVDESGTVKRFAEKPRNLEQAMSIFGEIKNPYVHAESERVGEPLLPANASYYLLQGDFFDRLPKLGSLDKPGLDFGGDIFPVLRDQINAYFIGAPWLDVGTPRDFWKAQWYFQDVAMRFTGTIVKNWGVFGSDISIDGDKSDIKASVVGNGVYLRNVRADHAIIGWDCQLQDVDLSYCVVMPGTSINMRRGCTTSGLITSISNSIVGGKLMGGSFIDSYSIPSRTVLDRVIVVPPEKPSQYIDITTLPLTDEDIQEARSLIRR